MNTEELETTLDELADRFKDQDIPDQWLQAWQFVQMVQAVHTPLDWDADNSVVLLCHLIHYD